MQGLALAFEVSTWQCDCNIKTFVYKSYNNISLKIVLVIISVLSLEKFWI